MRIKQEVIDPDYENAAVERLIDAEKTIKLRKYWKI